MQSKNKKRMTAAEHEHVTRVKSLPCSICDAPPYSDAHEPVQGLWWVSIALCKECHQGHNGWHGNKSLWNIRKMNELDALNITIKRLMEDI